MILWTSEEGGRVGRLLFWLLEGRIQAAWASDEEDGSVGVAMNGR